MRKKVTALVLAVLMALSLCACSGKGEVQEVIDNFEHACQNADIKEMLNCIDPSIAQPFQAIIVGAELLTGTDAENEIKEVTNAVVQEIFSTDYEATEVLKGFSTEDEKITIQKKTATVECRMILNVDGQEFKYDATITLKQKDDQWYITNIEKTEEKE